MKDHINCHHRPCRIHPPVPEPRPYPWPHPTMPPRPMPFQPAPAPWIPDRNISMNPMMNPLDMGPMGMWTMPQWDMQSWTDGGEDPEEMRDLEYWQQLYPSQTRQIQQEVSHQCDLLDYEGSVMYDEYPDRIALARICESIYQALMQNGIVGDSSASRQEFINSHTPMNTGNNMDDDSDPNGENYDPIDSVDMMQYPHKDRPGRPNRPSRTLQDLIEVMLYQEMHKRRRHHRKNRRWW